MDTSGFTALLSSVSRLPFGRITGGPLNVKLHPSAVEGEEGLAALAAALQTYFEQGGMSLMMNVVSRQQLQDAKEHPQRYKSLCVRVTGYSAYFVQMGSKAQNEMIRRTEER
jgi:formate C-acetyltransferase